MIRIMFSTFVLTLQWGNPQTLTCFTQKALMSRPPQDNRFPRPLVASDYLRRVGPKIDSGDAPEDPSFLDHLPAGFLQTIVTSGLGVRRLLKLPFIGFVFLLFSW